MLSKLVLNSKRNYAYRNQDKNMISLMTVKKSHLPQKMTDVQLARYVILMIQL